LFNLASGTLCFFGGISLLSQTINPHHFLGEADACFIYFSCIYYSRKGPPIHLVTIFFVQHFVVAGLWHGIAWDLRAWKDRRWFLRHGEGKTKPSKQGNSFVL
jgi:hypothetical protein